MVFTPRFDRASVSPWPPWAALEECGWLPHSTKTRSVSSRRVPSNSALSVMPTQRSTLETKSRGMAHWQAPEASELQPPKV